MRNHFRFAAIAMTVLISSATLTARAEVPCNAGSHWQCWGVLCGCEPDDIGLVVEFSPYDAELALVLYGATEDQILRAGTALSAWSFMIGEPIVMGPDLDEYLRAMKLEYVSEVLKEFFQTEPSPEVKR